LSERQRKPRRAGAFKEKLMRSRDQGALDAPILSHSTNHARRGSHKRPDPSRASDRPGLVTTRVCWARPDQEKPQCTTEDDNPLSGARRTFAGDCGDPSCGFFGGSLCASSGHSLSTTARISSEIWSMCSTSSMYLSRLGPSAS